MSGGSSVSALKGVRVLEAGLNSNRKSTSRSSKVIFFLELSSLALLPVCLLRIVCSLCLYRQVVVCCSMCLDRR